MVICSTLWSIAGIFIKLIPWNALVIAGWRSLISAGCVVVYMRAARLRVRVNRTSLVCGVFLALTFLAFVSANKLTTAANAIVLQFTAPVFILILSALVFRQRFARADVAAVLLTMCGIALFSLTSSRPATCLATSSPSARVFPWRSCISPRAAPTRKAV